MEASSSCFYDCRGMERFLNLLIIIYWLITGPHLTLKGVRKYNPANMPGKQCVGNIWRTALMAAIEGIRSSDSYLCVLRLQNLETSGLQFRVANWALSFIHSCMAEFNKHLLNTLMPGSVLSTGNIFLYKKKDMVTVLKGLHASVGKI